MGARADGCDHADVRAVAEGTADPSSDPTASETLFPRAGEGEGAITFAATRYGPNGVKANKVGSLLRWMSLKLGADA